MKWVGESFKVRDVQLSGGYRWFTLVGIMLMYMLVVNRGTLPLCLRPSASLTQ